MKGLVHTILDWNENKLGEIDIENDKHPFLKSFINGAIEGAIDSMVIWFPFVLGAAYYWGNKAKKR